MKRFAIIFSESLALSIFYSLKTQGWLSWILLLILYFSIGLIHGRIFKENAFKALLWVVVVGALAGILLTILNAISTPPAAGETVFTWLLFGLFVNTIVYSLFRPLIVMYLVAFIGIKISSGIRRQKNSQSPA